MNMDWEIESMNILRCLCYQGLAHILPLLILHRTGFLSDQIIIRVILSLESLAYVISSGV